MKKWLFNPFVYIAGAKALIIGWAFMLAAAVIGYFSFTQFDGVIDVHTGQHAALYFYLEDALVDWALPVIVFYIAGRIYSRSSIRLIDVAGTMALARWVMIFPAVIGFGVYMPGPNQILTTEELMKKLMTGPVIICGILTFVFSIWMIALMYNAFSTSCNLKGSKAGWIFAIGLLIAEIISKSIFWPAFLKL